MMDSRNKLKMMIVTALFAAIIGIMAQLTIPLPLVPITGQTLAVGLAATILGSRYGTISVLVYLAMGAVGMPVFSGMSSGLGVIFGPTWRIFDWLYSNRIHYGLLYGADKFQTTQCDYRQYTWNVRCVGVWYSMAKVYRGTFLDSCYHGRLCSVFNRGLHQSFSCSMGWYYGSRQIARQPLIARII